ncbi:hypothetical protein BV898_15985 [Hypsibius exemplaris]|uniref:CUB domain-containing protein n=1 Tax=Hypsibius exemplaris TaxID=2072580 RepID=A0A9X6NCN9_HYPEX|nr:hypothetical protein BV898_15985 [Hypsibius exemplaris]
MSANGIPIAIIGTLMLLLTEITLPSFALDELYPIHNLAAYCNGDAGSLLSLPCLSAASDRAGTLVFYPYPRTSCNVTVAVNFSSPCSTHYAIYFNFRDVHFQLGDSVEIYEDSQQKQKLFGERTSKPYSVEPQSHGQLRSSIYSRSPAFELRFIKKNEEIPTWQTGLVVDYIILRESLTSPEETTCKALGGSILDKHFCETGNRVNCPSRYSSVGHFVTNTQISEPGASIPPHCTKAQYLRPTSKTPAQQYELWLMPSEETKRRKFASKWGGNLSRLSVGVIVVALLTLLVIPIAILFRMYQQRNQNLYKNMIDSKKAPCPSDVAVSEKSVEFEPIQVVCGSGQFSGPPPAYVDPEPANLFEDHPDRLLQV